MARCRDCKLYDLDGARNARGAVLRNRLARCLWVSTETWPDSVQPHLNKRPQAGMMEPDEGERCKRFIKRMPTP